MRGGEERREGERMEEIRGGEEHGGVEERVGGLGGLASGWGGLWLGVSGWKCKQESANNRLVETERRDQSQNGDLQPCDYG